MKKYPNTKLVGVYPVNGTLLFGGSPMVYVFPQYMAVYRTECDIEEKFDRVYLFDEHVNSSTVEFDEELFEQGDSERGYYEDNAPLIASQYYGHEPMAYTVIDMKTFAAVPKKYDNRLSEYLFPLKTSHSMKLDKTMKYKVTLWLKKVGEMVGIESLSFIMNITSWNRLLSQTNFQEALLGVQ